MAAAAGFEPATKWLTATCSATELRSNVEVANNLDFYAYVKHFVRKFSFFLFLFFLEYEFQGDRDF